MSDPLEAYQRSDDKPDKSYSILPTVLSLAQPQGKRCLDVGCGSGFFTRHLYWAKAARVYGLDIDPKQINRAKSQPLPRIEYSVGDMFTAPLPAVDVITAPFVLNYAKDENVLRRLLERFYGALEVGGRLVAVIELPSGHDLRRFGAVKLLLGEPVDGTPIQIDIYHGEHICTLPWEIFYWSQETVTRLLREVGFRSVEWHDPIISQEGLEKYGEEFWYGYVKNPQLGYVVAVKG